MEQNDNERIAQAMQVAVEAGHILLENGAEIFRVEQTMELIARHYGVDSGHFFVLSNGIITSGGTNYSHVEFIPFKSVQLEKVYLVNNLSRKIRNGEYSIEQASEELKLIRQAPPKPFWEQTLASAFGSSAFCAIFGGSILDCCISFFAGLLLYILILKAIPQRMSKITCNILCSMFATAFCLITYRLGLGDSLGNMIIGALIPLIPGVAFTNGVRDLANQDYIAGSTRMADAMMVFFSIAAGVAITFLADAGIMNGMTILEGMKTDATTAKWPIQTVAAMIGTSAFGILFGVPRKQYIHIGICGVAGWITYLCILRLAGASVIESTFIATLIVVIVSRFMTVRRKCPVTIFEICGIVPLIPGAGIYWTTYFLVVKQYSQALSTGMTALGATAAIVLGIILITSLPGGIFKIVRKKADPDRKKWKSSVSQYWDADQQRPAPSTTHRHR